MEDWHGLFPDLKLAPGPIVDGYTHTLDQARAGRTHPQVIYFGYDSTLDFIALKLQAAWTKFPVGELPGLDLAQAREELLRWLRREKVDRREVALSIPNEGPGFDNLKQVIEYEWGAAFFMELSRLGNRRGGINHIVPEPERLGCPLGPGRLGHLHPRSTPFSDLPFGLKYPCQVQWIGWVDVDHSVWSYNPKVATVLVAAYLHPEIMVKVNAHFPGTTKTGTSFLLDRTTAYYFGLSSQQDYSLQITSQATFQPGTLIAAFAIALFCEKPTDFPNETYEMTEPDRETWWYRYNSTRAPPPSVHVARTFPMKLLTSPMKPPRALKGFPTPATAPPGSMGSPPAG